MDLVVRREAASSLSVLSRSHPVQFGQVQSTHFSLSLPSTTNHLSSPLHPLPTSHLLPSSQPPPVNGKKKRGNYKNKSKKLINTTHKTAVNKFIKRKGTDLVQSNPNAFPPTIPPTHPSVKCKTKARENAALWPSPPIPYLLSRVRSQCVCAVLRCPVPPAAAACLLVVKMLE